MTVAELVDRLDLAALPPRERATLRQVGPALVAGRHIREIAAALGVDRDTLADRLADVRLAIEQQLTVADADLA